MSTAAQRSFVLWVIAMVTLAGFVVWGLILVRQSLLVIYVSALLAIGFSPLVRRIEHQSFLPARARLPRWLAILVVYVGILGALAAIALVVLPPLIEQARALGSNLPAMIDQVQGVLVNRHLIAAKLTIDQIVQQAPKSGDAVGTVLLTLWSFLGGVFGVFTILILTFYLLVEADVLFAGLVRLFPADRRPMVRTLSAEITGKVSAWLTGQLILASVIGVLAATWLGLLGIPYFYVLALIAALGEMIPYVGPLLAAIPGMLVAFTISAKLALAATALYFAEQQFENIVLVPKLMERQVGLSAVGVIVALLLGAALLGVPGAILAVPTAAIIKVVGSHLLAGEE